MNRMQNGQIVNMRNFTAPYVFKEYPKHVALADGSFVEVHNADEEAAALGAEADVSNGADSLREALMAEARALGLNPHHKLGEDKLRQLIDEAKSHS